MAPITKAKRWVLRNRKPVGGPTPRPLPRPLPHYDGHVEEADPEGAWAEDTENVPRIRTLAQEDGITRRTDI